MKIKKCYGAAMIAAPGVLLMVNLANPIHLHRTEIGGYARITVRSTDYSDIRSEWRVPGIYLPARPTSLKAGEFAYPLAVMGANGFASDTVIWFLPDEPLVSKINMIKSEIDALLTEQKIAS